MQLRGYQTTAVDKIRELYARGIRKVLLHLATGAGKTVVFSHILKATSARGKRCVMVVRGRHLVEQAHKRLLREGVDHGVWMAGHWNFKPQALIQICSIDTLRARGEYPPADLIVIDEAHMATSQSYISFCEKYPNSYFLPVTATPYVDKPLTHIAQEIVHPVSVEELINLGFLVRPRYYAPSNPDLTGVRTNSATKDYVTSELSEKMSSSTLVGDVVSHWLRLCEGRATICFGVNVAHSKLLTEAFLSAGVRAAHVDASSSDDEREDTLKKLERGEIQIISNCGILCTGVDMPHVSAIIMARPTKSYNLFIQQAGRGTRPFDDKTDFLLLDHAGNLARHGFITHEPIVDLSGTKISHKSRVKTCENCFAVFEEKICPSCGFQKRSQPKTRKLMQIDGELEEVTDVPFEVEVQRFIEDLIKIRKTRGYKRGWIYHKLVTRYGEEVAQKFLPKRTIPDWVTKSRASGG